MTDRDKEKVLHGLSSCGTDYGIPNICEVTECPYRKDKAWCVHGLAHDAEMLIAELLKAQEPRLLELDEIKMLGLMWLESCNGFVQPVICQNYEYGVDRSVEFIMVHGTICNSINTFGKLWRVWTSKPSDEQMEAVKWK